MEDLVDRQVREGDFLLGMLTAYSHPSISLWRAIEAKEIDTMLGSTLVKRPLLDLGCGDGRFSKVALKGSSLDIGVDIAREAVSKAKHFGCYSNLGIAEGSMLPFRSKSIGTLISNSVLEHIPQVSSVLREASRVLRDDGVLIFTVPSSNFRLFLFPSLFAKLRLFNGLSEWYSNKRNTLLEHRNLHNHETWENWLGKAGFTSVNSRYCMSKETVQLWDIMALATCAATKAFQKFPRLARHLSDNTKEMPIRMLELILRRFYLVPATTGGDIVILATKRPFLEESADIQREGLAHPK